MNYWVLKKILNKNLDSLNAKPQGNVLGKETVSFNLDSLAHSPHRGIYLTEWKSKIRKIKTWKHIDEATLFFWPTGAKISIIFQAALYVCYIKLLHEVWAERNNKSMELLLPKWKIILPCLKYFSPRGFFLSKLGYIQGKILCIRSFTWANTEFHSKLET